MKFVPAGTPRVFFNIWETRVADFKAFVEASDYDAISNSAEGSRPRTLEEGRKWKPAGGSWKDTRFPSSAKQTEEHPVTCVSYLDAEAFCAWLTKKERAAGRIPADASYRLPTDSEWSRACGPSKYPWGNTFPPKGNEGNYSGKDTMIGALKGYTHDLVKAARTDGAARTSSVGLYGANTYGLHDMGGNVYEWCSSWYRATMTEADVLEKIPAYKDDKGGRHYRVLRGGSWDSFTEFNLRSSFRFNNAPRDRNANYGFRCVLVLSVG
jgi:formylglycine-generating enzyme required for sulfatase activity